MPPGPKGSPWDAGSRARSGRPWSGRDRREHRRARAEQITEVLERLERLGATLATVEATVNLHDAYIRELRQDRERGRTAGRASPAAARPAPATAAGDETAARPRGKGGKPLSPEQDKIIADMIHAERPYSEIASKAGVSIGAITKIRKRLGV
jgi:hypothetical protein